MILASRPRERGAPALGWHSLSRGAAGFLPVTKESALTELLRQPQQLGAGLLQWFAELGVLAQEAL